VPKNGCSNRKSGYADFLPIQSLFKNSRQETWFGGYRYNAEPIDSKSRSIVIGRPLMRAQTEKQ
jgi:hypothetical protein